MKPSLRTIEKRTAYGEDKLQKVENFKFLNKNVAKKGQIVFAGDSITDFYPLSDFFSEVIIKTGLEIYNRGISGDNTNELYRRFYDNVISIKPKCIVLLIGTNDLYVGAAPEFTEEYTDKILALIKKELPECKVILEAVYPVNRVIRRGGVSPRKNSNILDINIRLKFLSEKYKVDFVDLTETLSDENGNFNKDYTFDGLHPNACGYGAISKELIKHLSF